MEPSNPTSLQPEPAVEPTPPARPKDPYAGFDLARERRPGYVVNRGVRPWPNSRWPIEPQRASVPVFMHGRSNKTFPPVFGTDAPPHGLSGALRRLGYAYPDHLTRHWMILLLADRVDALGFRIRRTLPWAVPLALAGLAARSLSRRR